MLEQNGEGEIEKVTSGDILERMGKKMRLLSNILRTKVNGLTYLHVAIER